MENPNPQAYLCVLNNLISSQSGQLKAAGYHNKVCQPLLDKTSKSSIVLYEGNKGYGWEFSCGIIRQLQALNCSSLLLERYFS